VPLTRPKTSILDQGYLGSSGKQKKSAGSTAQSVFKKVTGAFAAKATGPSPVELALKRPLDPGFLGTAAGSAALKVPPVATPHDPAFTAHPPPVLRPTAEKPPVVAAGPAPAPPSTTPRVVVKVPSRVAVKPTRKAKPTRTTAARSTAVATPPGTGVSPVLDQAQQYVNAVLNPQIAAEQAAEARRQAVIKGATDAWMEYVRSQPAQAGGEYDRAIAQTQAIGQSGLQALKDSGVGANDQQLLAAINAPESQRADLAQNVANVFGGGGAVLNATQGTIPAAGLAANKASTLGYLRVAAGDGRARRRAGAQDARRAVGRKRGAARGAAAEAAARRAEHARDSGAATAAVRS
jgi:hypothetical protein